MAMTTIGPEVAHGDRLARLVLCFDGTWNTPEDQTNVSRIHSAIADRNSGCGNQLKFYDQGVGTTTGSRLTGGAFGVGLGDNILQGYCWLINQYPDVDDLLPEDPQDHERFAAGPDIFLFGFSRGAFTARSLAGLVNRCGLPRRSEFANGRAEPSHPIVKEAWKLYRRRFGANVEARREKVCVDFRERHCRSVKIRFVGVWDTVGALGVPLFSTGAMLSRLRYGFHDTGLGRVVEHAYHAVAIDEHRKDYQVALWDEKHPLGTREVEQRWFPGAHANVGGGYEDDLLPDPPLRWLALRAIQHGLEFVDEVKMRLAQKPCCKVRLPNDFELRGDEYLSPVRDSYRAFLWGAYRFFRTITLQGRHHRPMLVSGINETIDESAQMKWAADPGYRPPNLAHAGRPDFVSRGEGTPVVAHAAPDSSNQV